MNYEKTYYCLIQRRIDTPLDPSLDTEVHHIKPKSVYPEYEFDESNLVRLTDREHFIAHLLLAKWYLQKFGRDSEEYRKMQFAAYAMSHNKRYKKINSRTYA